MDRNGTQLGIPVFRKKNVKHLFVTLLLAFIGSIALFFGILTVSFFFGYRRSSRGWVDERRQTIEEQVTRALKEILAYRVLPGVSKDDTLDFRQNEPQGGDSQNEWYSKSWSDTNLQALIELNILQAIPGGLFLAVYDSGKKLIYRHTGHRGMTGMGRMMGQRLRELDISSLPLKPVKQNGKILGYYQIGSLYFGIDRANMQFIQKMRKILLFGSIAAFTFALLLALLLSRRISGSAQRVASGIDRIAQGDLSHRIPERGTAEIAVIAASANKLSQKLKLEEELRRQWAADVAHDLRTPITALKAQLEGIADGILDLTKDRIMKNMRELERIESLVDNLGELTRLESPEMRITPVPVDTESFFKELVDRFSPFFSGKHLSVSWDAKDKTFTGDEHLLLRSLSNFISNAIRHTPAGGRIRIAAWREGKRFLFSVYNTGKEIPKEEIDKVFDRLYRGERSRGSPGSGLGLTIAKKIAELHGGEITMESSPNGTTVQMYIKG